jgi:branched-chain amino acid transport system permease protein
MDFFFQQLVTGLAVGGTYALVALGFVLTFGVLNILNIAHAETIMICPFTLTALISVGVYPLPAFAIALAITVAFGVAVFLLALRPFVGPGREATHLASFIATFGICLMVENGVSAVAGSDLRSFNFPVPSMLLRVAGVQLAPMDLIIIAVVGVVLVGFAFLINYTHFGRSMRAIAENPSIVAAQGVNVNATILLTVVLASLLGGISGFLFAGEMTVVSPFMGLEFGLKGLVVMIVGGISSPLGAVVAGLLLGVIETTTVSYFSSVYRDVIAFGLLFAILLIHPEGLFSGADREGRP